MDKFQNMITTSCPKLAVCYTGTMKTINLMRLTQFALTFLLSLTLIPTSYAAGPRARDFYLNMGGGVFSPNFVMKSGAEFGVDGPPAGLTLGLDLGIDIPGLNIAAVTNDQSGRPENKQILSFGGSGGYKLNRYLAAEVHITLGFPNIQVRDIYGDDVVEEDGGTTGKVHILSPDLLPVGASVLFSPLPDAFISPYVGFGGVLALLDDRRAGGAPTDILIWDGGAEIGFLAHVGAYMDINKDWFAFVDIKYAVVDEPEMDDKFGNPVPIDRFEFRYFNLGGGLRF